MTTTIETAAVDALTNELIVQNFKSVAKGFEAIEKWMYHVQDQISEVQTVTAILSKQTLKSRGSKKKYALVLVAGVYVGRKLQDRATREKLKHMSDKLAEKTAAKVDTVLYGDKKHDEQPSKDAATWTRTRQPDPSVDVSPEKTLPN